MPNDLPNFIAVTYLYAKQSHSDESNPAVKRVEVVDALLVVEVEDSQESDHNARERQRVEDGVQQLHVDAAEASADAVEQHRCKWEEWSGLGYKIFVLYDLFYRQISEKVGESVDKEKSEVVNYITLLVLIFFS